MEGWPSLIAILYFSIDHRDGTLGAMRPLAKIAAYGAAIVCSAVLAVLLLLVFAVPERTAAALLSLEVGPCDHELKSCLKKWLARAFPDASPELAGAVTLSVTPSMRPFGITATLSVDDVELHDG